MAILSHVSDSTLPRLLRLGAAVACLGDYRPEGAAVSRAERLRLAELIGKGWSPADAADRVQAEIPPADTPKPPGGPC